MMNFVIFSDGSYLCCGTRDGDLLIYNFEDDVKELEYMKTMKVMGERVFTIHMSSENYLRDVKFY